MSNMKRLAELIDEMQTQMDGVFRQIGGPTHVADVPFPPVVTDAAEWEVRYSISMRCLYWNTRQFRYRGRRYQVVARLSEAEMPIVESISGQSGRTTFASPVRSAAEGDVLRASHEWFAEYRIAYEQARQAGLSIDAAGYARAVAHHLRGFQDQTAYLSRVTSEMSLPSDLRPLFRRLLAANASADPAEIAEITRRID